jgi:hypothetical protein
MILSHDLLTNPRTRHIFEQLPRTKTIIDVGPGIRPCPVFPCARYVAIEPHAEYCGHLREWDGAGLGGAAIEIINTTADALFPRQRRDTTILLIDVIEHMEKLDGWQILNMAMEFEHVVVFTPLGWYPQGYEHPDCWGLGGGFWQKHRSAWMPEDFPAAEGWELHAWPTWHPKNGVGAILAIR